MTTPTVPFTALALDIEPLTPIHIGSDDIVEPLEYGIDQVEQRGARYDFFVVLDLPALLAQLPPDVRSEFDAVIDRGDPPGVRAWLWKRYRQIASPKPERLRIQIMPDASERLRRLLTNNAETQVSLFQRDPRSGRIRVPGSSVKGAIRTAIVAAEAERQPGLRRPAQDRFSAEFEARVLGALGKNDRPDLYSDPLRQLHLEDAHLGTDASYLDRVAVIRRGESHHTSRGKTDGIAIFREMLWSAADDDPVHLKMPLRWHRELGDRRRLGNNALPLEITPDSIIEALRRHYLPLLAQELKDFECDESAADLLRSASEGLAPHQALIRIGRHSHFECLTLGKRWISDRARFGKSRSYQAASENRGPVPLGWCRVAMG